MRPLFWKIFLSVLLTVLLTFGVSLVIAFWLMPRPAMYGGMPPSGDRPPDGPRPSATEVWRSRLGDVFAAYTDSLTTALESRDRTAARQLVDKLGRMWGIRAYLVDEQDADIRGQGLTPEARQIVKVARHNDDVHASEGDRTLVVAQRLPAANNATYVLVGQITDRGSPPPSFFAWMTLWRIGPIAIGLSIVCLFLARYITGPVLTLRSALRRFAQGDLEQRVAPAIGRRRDEFGELARDFDHMAERIATLLNAQRRLLRDISHELRSPLARQRVALELARRQEGPDADRALDRVELEIERLDALIDELLGLTRLESESDNAKRATVDVADVLREVIENAEFEAHNDSRSVQLVACTPCKVTVVPELLRRAVENVVRNALAYTADGTTAEVSLHCNASEAVIHVRDHGPGVPDTELGDIFRPFYRVSRARERQTGGVGLGLAIVARAIQSHGGSIRATNHPEGGLDVELRLPIEPDGRA